MTPHKFIAVLVVSSGLLVACTGATPSSPLGRETRSDEEPAADVKTCSIPTGAGERKVIIADDRIEVVVAGEERQCCNMNETIQKLKYLQEADKAMDERLRSLEKLCGNVVSSTEDKAYTLNMNCGPVPTFCQMNASTGCGGGGWTLAMKIDGSKPTFGYRASLWTNQNSYNVGAGASGFDHQETKLPSYWSTPFEKICLGMNVGGETRFLVVQKQASSLYSLVADGRYRNTSLGRDAWKSFIRGSSLQRNCGKEGFNAFSRAGDHSRVRIGIIGNQENDCHTPDSYIGFGSSDHRSRYTCGNYADQIFHPDNGKKNTFAWCYIFVQ